jgi:hypothetical protein
MQCKYCGHVVDNPATHECVESHLKQKIDELREALESSNNLKREWEKTARIMADAADANVKSAAFERVAHAKTADVLRNILAESGSYLQAKTRDEASSLIARTGNCVCLPTPNPRDSTTKRRS